MAQALSFITGNLSMLTMGIVTCVNAHHRNSVNIHPILQHDTFDEYDDVIDEFGRAELETLTIHIGQPHCSV